MCDALGRHGITPLYGGLRLPWGGGVAVATLNGFSMRFAISRGCLQGGVLSPLPWCLVVDDLLARLSGNGVFIQGYTDDISLLVVGKFPDTVSELVQWALLTVQTQCNEVGLSVNPDKTGLVALTSKRKLPAFFERQFFGVKLRLSKLVKYLGFILNTR
jgi:hypothetical protein